MSVCRMIGKYCDNKAVVVSALKWLRVAYSFNLDKANNSCFPPLLAK